MDERLVRRQGVVEQHQLVHVALEQEPPVALLGAEADVFVACGVRLAPDMGLLDEGPAGLGSSG